MSPKSAERAAKRRQPVFLPPGHPFLGTDGGVWAHAVHRERIVRRCTIPQLRMILETPQLQAGIRTMANRRLKWLLGEAPPPKRSHQALARGFSLIELLGVIAIMAILAALLAPAALRAHRQAATRAAWTAYWHQAQIHQVDAAEGEFTAYWQMTPDEAFARLYVQRGIQWHQVDAGLRRQWTRSLTLMENPR